MREIWGRRPVMDAPGKCADDWSQNGPGNCNATGGSPEHGMAPNGNGSPRYQTDQARMGESRFPRAPRVTDARQRDFDLGRADKVIGTGRDPGGTGPGVCREGQGDMGPAVASFRGDRGEFPVLLRGRGEGSLAGSLLRTHEISRAEIFAMVAAVASLGEQLRGKRAIS